METLKNTYAQYKMYINLALVAVAGYLAYKMLKK